MKKVGSPVPTSQDNREIQLRLFPDFTLFEKSGKRQISSIPGVHPTEAKRYRVMVGGRVIRDRLTLDEALQLAKVGGKQ